MPRISGKLSHVTGDPDLVTSISVSAVRVRPSGAGLITTSPKQYTVTDGQVTFPCEPGLAQLTIHYLNSAVESVPLLVPEGSSTTLSVCYSAALDAAHGQSDAVLSEIVQLLIDTAAAEIEKLSSIKDLATQDVIDRINKAIEDAPSSLRWYKGILPKNTDLNNMFGYESNGAYGLDNSQSNAMGTYKNLPELKQGTLTVLSTPQGFTTQIFQAFGSGNYWTRSQSVFGKPQWTKWVNVAVTAGIQIPLNTDMNMMFGPDWAGNWSVDNKTNGAIDSYANLPEVAQGTLTVKVSEEGFSSQTFQAFGSGNYWTRSQSVFGKPQWTKWVNVASPPDDTVFEHNLRVARARNRKLPDRVSNIAVALVLDHGTNILEAEFIPLLRELNIPVTIALNSGMYNPDDFRYQYNNKTTWDTIRRWAADPNVEIANHGVTHGNVRDPDKQKWEVEQSLADLEKNLPGVEIDSFVCPAGLTMVTDMLGFSQNEGTRAMYAKHAVLVTAVTPQRWPLTGEPRLGMSRFWAETPAGIAKSKSDILATPKGWGTMVSFHPEVLGQNGKASLDEAKEFIRWLAQQRDEGKITLLTLRDIAFAQAA